MPLWVPAAMGAAMGYRMASNRYRGKTLRGTVRKSMMTRRSRSRAFRLASLPRRRVAKRVWKARARRSVGLPRNFSTSKTTETIFPIRTQLNRNVVALANPIRIGKGAEMDKRLRDTVNISGFRMDMWCLNNQDRQGKLVVNWAVINPRGQQDLLGENGTERQVIPNFFRDYNDHRDWQPDNISKTGLTWSEAKINIDNFHVLARGKFELNPVGAYVTEQPPNTIVPQEVDPSTYSRGQPEKFFTRYIKINRAVTFDGDSIVPEEQVRIAIWCSNRDGGTSEVGPGERKGMVYRLRTILYFREPKTG